MLSCLTLSSALCFEELLLHRCAGLLPAGLTKLRCQHRPDSACLAVKHITNDEVNDQILTMVIRTFNEEITYR